VRFLVTDKRGRKVIVLFFGTFNNLQNAKGKMLNGIYGVENSKYEQYQEVNIVKNLHKVIDLNLQNN